MASVQTDHHAIDHRHIRLSVQLRKDIPCVEIDAKGFDWEKFESEVHGAPNRRFDIVYDFLTSGYCVAGKILIQSDEWGFHGVNEIEPATMLSFDYPDLAAKLSLAFERTIDPEDLKLLLFTNWR